MVNNPVSTIFEEHSVMTRSFPLTVRGQDKRSTAFGQWNAVTIQIGTRQLIAPTHAYIVCAVDALTTLVERNEKVQLPIMRNDEWPLDGRCFIGACGTIRQMMIG